MVVAHWRSSRQAGRISPRSRLSVERLAFILSDARCPLVLTAPAFADRVAAGGQRVVTWTWTGSDRRPHPPRPHGGQPRLRDLHLRSTGRPKGVEITHASLLNLVSWHRSAFQITPADRATQIAAVGFGRRRLGTLALPHRGREYPRAR